jgi:predicted transcriptional regulator
MIKNFLMKKLMEHKLKNLPADQKDMIMALMEKNPKLFEEIAKEIQAKVKAGTPEQTASMQVMMKHKNELQKLAQEYQSGK